MKLFTYLIIVVAMLSSCAKHKEKKRWKSYQGMYECIAGHHLIKDSVSFNKIDVTDAGISLVGGGKSINMNVYIPELNDDERYDYKCEYHNLTSYVISGGNLANETWSNEEFAQGRLFYITFEGKNLMFTIKNGEQVTDIHLVKQ